MQATKKEKPVSKPETLEQTSVFHLKITRRGIQIALGLTWLLDGILQLQRQMFTSNFATDVITPALQGQPRFVSSVMHFWIHIFLLHPLLCNLLIAVIQLGLGAMILWKPAVRYGLIGSVVWGLFVWYVGEGLGGLGGGQGLLLMGAPGAALLYVVISLGIMPVKHKKKEEAYSPSHWLAIAWAILWVAGAIYQLMPGQNTVTAVSSMISDNAMDAPGWLASIDTHIANIIHGIGTQTTQMSGMHMSASQMAAMPSHPGSGFWFILVLAITQALIGLAALLPGYTRKVAIGVGIVLSLCFWIVGQSFGEYYSGLATDPSTAPLFIMLGVAILAHPQLDAKKLWHDIINLKNHKSSLSTLQTQGE